MNPFYLMLTLLPLAYLGGSIPFGLLVGLSKGIDPRKSGSGNIGATNVGRLLGGKYFAIVFTLDLLKGLCPMLLAAIILRGHVRTERDYVLWLLVGFSAILGHMFSIFLKFKGGKGVATTLGVALGVFPYYTFPALIAAAGFILLFLVTRIVSISSIVAIVIFLGAYIVLGTLWQWDILGNQLPLLAFAVLLSAIIIYRHRGNIARMIAGTENRFGANKEQV